MIFRPVYFVLPLILILCTSCETNPPNMVAINKEYGKVFINANINGAKIFIDNAFSGKMTPDTISAEVGEHEIRVEIENYFPETKVVQFKKGSVDSSEFILEEQSINKIVLLEDFSNVGCVPCVNSNRIIQSLLNNLYGNSRLVVIKYPANFPSPNDPMYLENTVDCDARKSYYNVFSTPSIRIDGILKPVPTDSISIKEKIDERLLLISILELTIDKQFFGNNLSINVEVNVKDASGINFSEYVLQTAVVEEEVSYATPPGSNGETAFYHVIRKMLPSNEGENLNSISGNGKYTFNRQMSVNSGWDKSKLEVIVFIQNTSTKEVIQTASTGN